MITGPNIAGSVDGSCKLLLDVANEKSFKGESTINLVVNPTISENITGYSLQQYPVGSYGPNDGIFYDGSVPGLKVVHETGYTNGQTWANCGISGTFVTGVTYTASVYCKCSVTSAALIDFYNGSWLSSYHTGTNEWIRLTVTFIAASASIGFRLGIYTKEATAWFKNFQIEQKGYVTPFVNGTRGSTVATGGGLADLSGTGNNGELSGTTFDSGYMGSLIFNGSGDYTTVTNGGPYGNCSVEMIIKRNSDAEGQSIAYKGTSFHLYFRGSWAGTKFYFIRNTVGASNYGDSGWPGVGIYMPTLTLNEIAHVIFTHDIVTGIFCAYKNGILVRTITVDPATYGGLNETTGSFLLGFGWGYAAMNLYVFKNHNRVLTSSEVLQNFTGLRHRYSL